MDISEVTENLYIASRFYEVDGDWPHGAVAIDCAMMLDDKPCTNGELRDVEDYAFATWKLLGLGVPVVLVCEAGRNRSALIAAAVLKLKGWEAKDAIDHVRHVRSFLNGGALTNQSFVDYLS